MAKEKTKYDKKYVEPEHIKKTKRNRHPKECSINRREGCGICGSLNVVLQGVIYCEICGKEFEILTEDTIAVYLNLYIDRKKFDLCNCVDNRGYNKYYQKMVLKCLDCGAIATVKVCPNNSNHIAWRSVDGKKRYCRSCGYRI